MTSLSLSRHSRLAQRKKRARDSEAADSLLQLSKHPRITADRDGDSSGNGDDTTLLTGPQTQGEVTSGLCTKGSEHHHS